MGALGAVWEGAGGGVGAAARGRKGVTPLVSLASLDS